MVPLAKSCQITSNIFDLSHTVLHCNHLTTLEDFSDGILVDSKLGNRLDDGEIGTSMDSDQVSSEKPDGFRVRAVFFKSLFGPFVHNLREVHFSPFSLFRSLKVCI